MPKPQQKSRPTTQLSSAQSQQLKAYALAASAAGVGLLALTHPAEAEVVYTPAHFTFKGVRASVFIDVNHDGLNDYQLNLINTREFDVLYVLPWGGRIGPNQQWGRN